MHPLLQSYVDNGDCNTLTGERKKASVQVRLGDYCNSNDEWTLETIATNSCLYDLERMLAVEDKLLEDFELPIPNFEKEQYIQNYLMDHYIAEEDNFLPEKAKAFFKANHPKLNKDQKEVLEFIRDLIISDNKEDMLIFLDAFGGDREDLHFECFG